ncbi:MAG: O-antigen ligase family protein [Planctomycetaceae bacterium]|nr:O-antigen ligase family protein [Planctomycetaceae bacterium]
MDIGIVMALVGVALLLGGTRPPGHLLLITSTFLAAIGWLSFCSLHPKVIIKWTGAEFLIVAGLLVATIQIVPLPATLINLISPKTKILFSEWTKTGLSSKPWPYLSLSPQLSRSELTIWFCYAILFLTTSQRLRGIADVETVLRLLTISSIGMAALGLVQMLVGNDKFLWCYQHPHLSASTVATGSFINRNHFASFLAMGVGPALWWWWTAKSRSENGDFCSSSNSKLHVSPWILALALVLIVFTILLSQSRGGAIASSVAIAFFLVVQLRRYPSRRLISVLLGASLIVGTSLAIYGYDLVSSRLSNWNMSHRLYLWKVNCRTFSDFPIIGTGLNTHRLSYPLHYELPSDDLVHTHAESSYVQILSEMGILGVLLTIFGLRLICVWSISGLRTSPSQRHGLALLALSASLAAHAVHAAGDSLWSIPGLMAPVSIITACIWRMWNLGKAVHIRTKKENLGTRFLQPFCLPRLVWGVAASLVLATGLTLMKGQLLEALAWPHLEEYERLALIQSDKEYSPSEIVGQRILALNAAQKYLPDNSSISSHLASEHLNAFSLSQLDAANIMSLTEIRDVAGDPSFASQEERIAWLRKSLGDNLQHLQAVGKFSKDALLENPMAGCDAINLVQLDFLHPELHVNALEHHALKVRPNEPSVLFSAGQRAFGHGKTKLGFHYWQKASQTSPKTELLVLRTLHGLLSAKQILGELHISRKGIHSFWQQMENEKNSEDYCYVSRKLGQRCQQDAVKSTGQARAELLLQAFEAYRALDDKEAEHCLNQALKAEPESIDAHEIAARWYFQRSEYRVAQRHIEWCLLRTPKDSDLIELHKQSLRRQASKDAENVSVTR